jgi:K(+)-stimulated pyrophosphate-energized sodium pump
MTGVAFTIGAICSGISGFIGMYVSVDRTSVARRRRQVYATPLAVSLRGGAVSGFLVVALSLLG